MAGKVILLLTVLVLITGSVIAAAPALQGHAYDIGWWTVNDGGGTSFGGPYRLSGTSGQAEAGQHSGGVYKLSGGFWTGGNILGVVSKETIYLPLVVKGG